MYNLIIPDSLAKSQPDFDPLNNISMPLEKALHKAEVAYLKEKGNNYYKVKSVSLRPFHSWPQFDSPLTANRQLVLLPALSLILGQANQLASQPA